MPVLLSTNSRPSSESSSPAVQPSSVDRVSRRATRHMTRIASVPKIAGAKRQPSEVSPKSHSPTAISSLPTSGWTTYSPQPVPEHVWKRLLLKCPATIWLFT